MKWCIGNVEIKNQIVLAPMAGVCNCAFRRIVKEMGAGLIYAEMVSDKAIVYHSKKTIDMLYMKEEERPIVQQIFGSDKTTFVEAAKFILDKMKPDIIDINMGCPVPKVALRAQAGAALLKDKEKIYEIVKAVVDEVDIPVTVKIRSGWSQEDINAVEVAQICEKAGAKAICIHARTRSQGYSGKADWNIIKQVKKAVKIPVIGNGDVTSAELAKKMLEDTGCDAVMIGRGALGNPWLIKDAINYIDYGIEPRKVPFTERIEMCLHHLAYLKELKDEHIAATEIRSHIAWYLKGMPNSTEIKNKVYQTKKIDDIILILNQYKEVVEKGE